MKSPLHILHLEDDPNDFALIRTTLETEGIACVTTRVENQDDFVAALGQEGIDLILSDCSLPGFDGLSALKIAHSKQPDLPVIFVSGIPGEEMVIESLKSGATDFVLKERLVRLAPAVRRAMHDVQERVERKQREAQIIETQKMEMIGQLAAGVAHDFNNILAVIMGYSDLITADLPHDSLLRSYTEEIFLASEQAAGLTRQLLVFSRKQTVRPVVLNLNEVIRSMDKMLPRLMGETIKIETVLEEPCGRIRADSGYIGQLLMNLIINARDAMPEGGRLTIQTRNVLASAEDVHESGSNRYVVLTVSDVGMGMTADVKEKLFDAFFTTKAEGKGIGLGLTTCQMIAKQSHARIEVISQEGKGTTFNVYFPSIDQPLPAELPPASSAARLRGTETVLVVEDEAALRRVACMGLKAQGYTVLQAENGLEGLHVVNEHKGPPIALVITDVIMPQMGGNAMAEELKATHPDLKILFCSGYNDATVVGRGVIDLGTNFLPKPYSLSTLTGKVRKMLDQPQTPAVNP